MNSEEQNMSEVQLEGTAEKVRHLICSFLMQHSDCGKLRTERVYRYGGSLASKGHITCVKRT